MAVIRRKVFVGPTIYFGFKGLNYYRDNVRNLAETFINEEIGLERVISVQEHVTSNGPFSVAVWYSAEDDASSQSQLLSNSDLKSPANEFHENQS